MNKVVIYTCRTNNYDRPKPHAALSPWCDYVCINDSRPFWPSTHQSRLLYHDFSKQSLPDPSLKNRFAKVFPHLFFPEYTHSLYIDGNITIESPRIYDRLADLIDRNVLLSMARHPDRDCVYQEIDSCLALHKDRPEALHATREMLRANGYPEHNGLYFNGLMFREHNVPAVTALMEDWWTLLTSHSRRDQISLPYLLAKHGLAVEDWNEGYVSPISKQVIRGITRHSHAVSRGEKLRNSCRKRLAGLKKALGLQGNTE